MSEMEGMHGNETIIIDIIVYKILKTFHLKYKRQKDKEINNNSLNLGFPQ